MSMPAQGTPAPSWTQILQQLAMQYQQGAQQGTQANPQPYGGGYANGPAQQQAPQLPAMGAGGQSVAQASPSNPYYKLANLLATQMQTPTPDTSSPSTGGP